LATIFFKLTAEAADGAEKERIRKRKREGERLRVIAVCSEDFSPHLRTKVLTTNLVDSG
jgi:hypothetical protein